MELDRLSALPNTVTQRILSCLPIKEAVRTSVLATSWRLRWTMLPRIVFDEADFYDSTVSTADIVDHVLFVHVGSIHTFSLSTMRIGKRVRLDYCEYDKWILHLSRKSIKELELKIRDGDGDYKITSHLFSCQDLTHLKLWNCSLLEPPPSTFKGFGMLKSLRLERVYVPRSVLEKMISCSPLLERMALCYLQNKKGMGIPFPGLKIDAPNLQFLQLRGLYEDLQLNNAMNLVDVSVSQYKLGGVFPISRKFLEGFVYKLPRIQRLSIEGNLLECNVAGFLPEEQFTPCLYLKFLSLRVCADKLEQILAAICLLRSSPALQELEILVIQNVDAIDTDWLSDNQDCKFIQLRRLKVIFFSGRRGGEKAFVKFLFLSSPALKELEISFDEYNRYKVEPEGCFWFKNCSSTQLRLVKIRNFSLASHEVELVKFLLLTSPALEKLEISFSTYDRENRRLYDRVVGEDEYPNCTFTQLRVIELNGFSGVKEEVSFIRFLFTCSPVIERATLQPASGNVSWEVTKLLAELKSVSSYTDFKFLEPLEDWSDSSSDDYSD